MTERFNLPLCDLPHNAGHQQVLEFSNHDVFNTKDLEAVCNLAEYGLKHEGRGRISSPAVQFPFRWQYVRAYAEEVEGGLWKTEMCKVEQLPTFYSLGHGKYL